MEVWYVLCILCVLPDFFHSDTFLFVCQTLKYFWIWILLNAPRCQVFLNFSLSLSLSLSLFSLSFRSLSLSLSRRMKRRSNYSRRLQENK